MPDFELSSIQINVQKNDGSIVEHTFRAPQTVTIGSDQQCSLVVSGRGVSRKHCQLVPSQRGWRVQDLNSTNGTIINGHAIPANELSNAALKNGDTLKLGETVLGIHLIENHATELLRPELPVSDETELIRPDLNAQDLSGSNSDPKESPMRADGTIVFAPSNPDSKAAPTQSENRKSSLPATTSSHPSAKDAFPRPFNQYMLQKVIGTGGMGQVFLATSAKNNKSPVAIKLLKSQAEITNEDRARFVREMDIALKFVHPSFVRSYDCGFQDEQLFIVMEYCVGGNLSELLSRSGKLNIRRAVRLMDRLLAGMEQVHTNGIVHRDLKPQNILLQKDARGKYLPKISDFGLAKSYLHAGNSEMTANGVVGGSWSYMPREQLTNFRFVSPTSDVWSLGAILYESLTLKLPRNIPAGTNPIRGVLQIDVTELREVMPDCPPELNRFMNMCIATEPKDRFSDAGAMRSELHNVARTLGIEV